MADWGILGTLADLEQATTHHCTATAHLEKGEATIFLPPGGQSNERD